MKNSKVMGIVVALVLLIGVIYVVLKYQGANRELSPITDESGQFSEVKQLERDRDILETGRGTPHEIYGAMIRLARNSEALARAEALRRSNDPQTLLREGAAQALGFFPDDECFEALKGLLSDKEETVRLFAIEGLGSRMGALREKELQAILEQPDLNDSVRVAVYASLAKVAESPEVKAERLKALADFALTGDEKAHTDAVSQLTILAPLDPVTQNVMRQKVSQAKNERAVAIAIRQLSSANDSYVKQYLNRLAKHESPKVRLAVVQSLHRACPEDRWEILSEIVKVEKDNQVLRAGIEESQYLSGDRALEFLREVIGAGYLSQEMAQIAESTRTKVEKAPSADPCHR